MGAEVLKCYGYSTSAFGKWHNTPGSETTSKGPFDKWPTGVGIEYFYGFLAGGLPVEPILVENTTAVIPEEVPMWDHLTADLADNATEWLRERGIEPDKPFFMYWATGACTDRTMSPRSGPTSTRGSSTTAGTNTTNGSSSAPRSRVGSPRRPS